LEAETRSAIELNEEIETNFPPFRFLPEETQIEIIAAALYLNLQIDDIKAPAGCREKAAANYAADIVFNHAMYNGALVACGFSGPAVGACAGFATVVYGIAQGRSYYKYKKALKGC
jgi:hypothetical protein